MEPQRLAHEAGLSTPGGNVGGGAGAWTGVAGKAFGGIDGGAVTGGATADNVGMGGG